MANGHLLAASDRLVNEIGEILDAHNISCELQYVEQCDHDRYVVDLTVLLCSTVKTQIDVAIEKRRGRAGADILLVPGRRSTFRRDLDSEQLAERIAEVLCENGARHYPDARCQALG